MVALCPFVRKRVENRLAVCVLAVLTDKRRAFDPTIV